MYIPRHFEETRVEVLHAHIAAYPLGTLVAMTSRGLEANHLPFALDPRRGPFGTLRGHVARANPLWQQVASGAEVVTIFTGPEAYVSPSWYPGKRDHGKVVPTWNYAAVHAHGPLQVIDDREWLRGLVTELTAYHERRFAIPWQVTDAPPDYIDRMLDAIVGIEIPIGRLEGKWKVSQNRAAADREGVADNLDSDGGDNAAAMARLVRTGPAE